MDSINGVVDLNTKEGLLLKTLIQFFEKPKNYETMVPILTESSPISLRVLDWFITNYSKEHTKTIVKDALMHNFNVYSSYKSQLKAYNKKLFDPFCRLHNNGNIKKFKFTYDANRSIMTTTGQLNFFKWAIENHIIEYVNDHYEEIKADLKRKEMKKKEKPFSAIEEMTDSSTKSSPTSSDIYDDNKTPIRKPYVIRFS